MRWKYDIKLSYINGGKTTQIDSVNIRKLFVDHNYKEKLMPTMYCTLNIDKNLFDDIIINASNATMKLRVDKVVVNDQGIPQGTSEPMWDAECLYFIDHDINYNKEIDYDLADKNRKDVYKEVSIGLMFKDCIEHNKQVNNTTVIDSTMMNIVGKFIQDIPTLIEPFTYNPTYEQLIIPPHDSLYKTLEFLNKELSVFYDTPCRIFFEPDALYIMSSSGKPVARKTDVYDTVRFIVYKSTDQAANAWGMGEDKEAKAYVVNINALDTDYKIDHDTSKQFNNVASILNPAKDNSVIELGSIQDTISKINSIGKSFVDKVKSFSNQAGSVLSEMNIATNNLTHMNIDNRSYLEIALSAIAAANAKIQAMPEPSAAAGGGDVQQEQTITKEEKAKIQTKLNEIKTGLASNSNEYGNIIGDYNTGKKNASSIIGNISNSSGYVGGVTAINVKANTNTLTNCMGQVKIDSGNLSKYHLDKLVPYNDVTGNLVRLCQEAISIINSSNIEPEKITKDIGSLHGCFGGYSDIMNNTANYIDQFAKYSETFAKTATSLVPAVNNLKKSSSSVDLKGIMSNSFINVSTLGNVATSMLNKFAQDAQSKIQALAESGLSFDSLDKLTKDITSVKDITSLGKLGISSFDMELNLGKEENTGTKIIPVKNDNANMLKNIKAGIENNKNTISLYKQDMDVSVFNINKKYIIRNYDTHSDKDGLFLLDRRVDVFIREDDKFLGTCLLTFSKVANSSAGEAGKIRGQMSEEDRKTLEEDIAAARKFLGLDTIGTSPIANAAKMLGI